MENLKTNTTRLCSVLFWGGGWDGFGKSQGFGGGVNGLSGFLVFFSFFLKPPPPRTLLLFTQLEDSAAIHPTRGLCYWVFLHYSIPRGKSYTPCPGLPVAITQNYLRAPDQLRVAWN